MAPTQNQHGAQTPQFPPLEEVTQPNVTTEQAAHYLNRRPQTMRRWACFEDGPLRPLRINGRLAWSVSDLRRVTGLDKSRLHGAERAGALRA